MDDVKLTDYFYKEISRRYGVRPEQVVETLTVPDKTDVIEFGGSAIEIHLKTFGGAAHPYVLLAIETPKDGERTVNSAFKVYPELTSDLKRLSPVQVLRLLADSFGLLIQVGKQVGKLILQESFEADSDGSANLVRGLELPRGSLIQEIIFKSEEGPPKMFHCGLALALDTDAYSAWLTSVARQHN